MSSQLNSPVSVFGLSCSGLVCVCFVYARDFSAGAFVFCSFFCLLNVRTKRKIIVGTRVATTAQFIQRSVEYKLMLYTEPEMSFHVYFLCLSLSLSLFLFCAVMFCSAHVCFLVRRHHFLRLAIKAPRRQRRREREKISYSSREYLWTQKTLMKCWKLFREKKRQRKGNHQRKKTTIIKITHWMESGIWREFYGSKQRTMRKTMEWRVTSTVFTFVMRMQIVRAYLLRCVA